MTVPIRARSPAAAALIALASTVAFAGAAEAGSNIWRGPLYFYEKGAPAAVVPPPKTNAAKTSRPAAANRADRAARAAHPSQ